MALCLDPGAPFSPPTPFSGLSEGYGKFGSQQLNLIHPQDIATMQLCANKLDKKDFFGKSDPFLVFYRSNEDGT
jgi:hypothetical protein